MTLKYRFHSGKNWKFPYYFSSITMHLVPRCVCNWLLPLRYRTLTKGQDEAYIRDRVDYYCRLDTPTTLSKDSDTLGTLHAVHPKVYYHDFYRTQRWFSRDIRCILLPGDVTHVPETPSIVKSRPINGDNRNSVVLKLDRVRHFVFLKDTIPFEQKSDRVIFRGGVNQPHRRLFMQKFFGNPLVDAREVTKHPSSNPPEWRQAPMTFYEHLPYKFIMAIEGNDVASNLKWVMSSNSIAVMPRPTYETWFMEGRLIPDYHYIEIRPDYSDLEERVRYYIEHIDEAKAIIEHAHQYVAQFRDTRREKLLETLVFRKYIEMTGQKSSLNI